MKKWFIILFTIFSIFIINVNAKDLKKNTIEVNDFSLENTILSDFILGEIEYVNFNGQRYKMYPVFSDQSEALNLFKKKNTKFIDEVNTYYMLDDLADNNWLLFAANARKYINEVDNEVDGQLLFNCFFDIYENRAQNDEIIERFDANTKSRVNKDMYAWFYYEMPYTANLDPNLFGIYTEQNGNLQTMSIPSIFDVSDGLAYANQYAISPNGDSGSPTWPEYPYYYFSNGDCANFASQILEAGGVTQAANPGWWHRKTGTMVAGRVWYTHTHSATWSMADDFAKYWGVHELNKYYGIEGFSAALTVGSFIGLDHTGDGSFDHIGFVTAKKTYQSSYCISGTNICRTYYDFKIAQHTKNYNEWVSSNTNGWDTFSGSGRYVIIK